MKENYYSINLLLEKFRSNTLLPSDVIESYQSQYLAVNDKVNAFSFTYFDEVKVQAKQADNAYKNGTAKGLQGICVAIKDETYIEGQPMTNGSVLLKDNIATSTDPVARRLIDEQALVIGRTTTPEFSTNGVTWSDLWGVSRSPWNTEITCGGSSGGSAIAVASGMAAFANGTDIGGSVRIPAAMCGVYGYKPPHGRVPEIAPFNIDPYCHHGVLARNVADIKLAYNKIKGRDWIDSHSFIPDINPELIGNKVVSELKVAVSYNLGFYQVEPDIVSAIKNTALLLQDEGVQVDEVEPQWDEQVIETAKIHQRALMGQLLRRNYEHSVDSLTSYVEDYLSHVGLLTAQSIFDANLHACDMWEKLAKIFKDYDLIICPTVATTKVKADYDYSKDDMIINGKKVDSNKGWFMTYPFNTLGQCPVLSMPNGMAANKVPTSIQIIGRPYEEQHVFTLAKYLEQAQPHRFYQALFPQYQPEA